MATRPTQLQIFGERCSGTNYVAQLLRKNLPGLLPSDPFGWKHGWPEHVRDDAPDCLFVVVHRDPFAWAQSLHRQPWHAAPPLRALTFAEFVRAEWWCEWGQDMELPAGDDRFGTEMLHERDPRTGRRFADVLALRTAKLRAWLQMLERVRHGCVVRYEDALAAPRELVRTLAQRCGLRRWPWFRPVRTFKGGRDPFVARPLVAMAPADVAWIAARLDRELERTLGHDLSARCAALLQPTVAAPRRTDAAAAG